MEAEAILTATIAGLGSTNLDRLGVTAVVPLSGQTVTGKRLFAFPVGKGGNQAEGSPTAERLDWAGAAAVAVQQIETPVFMPTRFEIMAFAGAAQ
jgi:hypothetical protein